MNELVKIDLTDYQFAALLRKHKAIDNWSTQGNVNKWFGKDNQIVGMSIYDSATNSRKLFLEKQYLPKYRTRVYKLYTYDVWGNWRDGWEVNNRFGWDEKQVKCRLEIFNEGKPGAFAEYCATDRQLNRMVGAHGCHSEIGEPDYTLYFESKSGKPVYELEFIGWAD